MLFIALSWQHVNLNVIVVLEFISRGIYLLFTNVLGQKHALYSLGLYPPALQLNKANTTDLYRSPFLDLHLSMANGFLSSKIYDKRDDFDFDIVNFLILDGDVNIF